MQLFLVVCKELGITPLLVIEPVNGEYYDIQRYTKESRAEFYDELRDVLDGAEVDYLDLSGHDYDKYYLRDVMHLGWKSWVEVDRALCEFYGAGKSAGAGDEAGNGVHLDRGETAAEQDAETAADDMLEVEGAGKEVVKDEGAAS